MSQSPDFTIGIEEEYLLVDPDTGKLAAAPPGMMEDCQKELEGQFSPEFKACQVEIGTRVSKNANDAREDLRRLRQCVSHIASNYGLAPIAASCHPFGDWKETGHTDRDRYNDLERALAGVARRMLICGMHVHVGIPREEMRIDLLSQLSYFLPHLLSLSTSSPYWQGHDTGLSSYRLTVFDNLPRTGLPPALASWGEFDRIVSTFVDLDIIEDSSKIWWDLRPSSKYPTLEARIFDVTPRMEHTLLLATLFQCLTRMLWRLSRKNQRWRTYDRFLIGENRWRAQRFGATEGLIDFGRRAIVPVPELLSEIQELIAEDADALGVTDMLERAPELIENGTSAERQRKVYADARDSGLDHDAALQAIVTHLIEEFTQDL